MTSMLAGSMAEPGPPPVWPAPRPGWGYAFGKDDYPRRLRKFEGYVRGLQKMIKADAWCPGVVIQVVSATRALQEVAVGLLSAHLAPLRDRRSSAEGGARLSEVATTIRQVVRL